MADVNLGMATTIITAVIVGVGTLVAGRNNRWKSNFDAEKVENERLIKENNELKLQNSKLASLPNLEKLYELNLQILTEIKGLAKSTKKVAENK